MGSARKGNARTHGRYSAKARELLALGRLQNRVADLTRAQLAVMESFAQEDARRGELAEKRISPCVHRLRKAAHAIDRVLVERGDDEGRRRLVARAVRLTENV